MFLGNTCVNFDNNIFHNLGINLSKKESVKAMFSDFLLKKNSFLSFIP